MRKAIFCLLLLAVLVSALPAQGSTAFPTSGGNIFYDVTGQSITITGYRGNDTNLQIPAAINERPVTVIGERAFLNSTSLTNVTIPSSVTTIEASAFESCTSLTSVTIPSSVTTIEANAFAGCGKLTGISVETRNSAYMSADGVLFDKSGKTLVYYPTGKSGAYTVPSSVTAIEDFAFSGCSSLTSVTIPSSVAGIGLGAFSACGKLTDITVETRNSAYMSADGVLFDKSGTTLICYPAGKSGAYTVPSSVATIGNFAFFGCSSLTSVTIPLSVTAIGLFAFSDCTSLTNVFIPSSVAVLEMFAFAGCTSLTNITLSRRTKVEDYAFGRVRFTYSD